MPGFVGDIPVHVGDARDGFNDAAHINEPEAWKRNI